MANCAADPSSYTTDAFGLNLSRGMVVSSRCQPETGERPRGLGIGSVSRRGRVERGAYAQLTIDAPPGTQFASYEWTGKPDRVDCRYAMQVLAVFPDGRKRFLRTWRANRKCEKRHTARAASIRASGGGYPIPGASQVVQRVVCVGKDGSGCSGGSGNRLWTNGATAEFEDGQPPAVVALQDTPLTTGVWVRGPQPLNYDASDNAGVFRAAALVGAKNVGTHDRPCRLAHGNTFAVPVPCTNGRGTMTVETHELSEGTQSLVVQAVDPAGNVANAEPIAIRIDREAPARVDVAVEGGQEWRSRNDFAVWWANPVEADRAPIAGAVYKLCPVAGGACLTGEHTGAALPRFGAPVARPGEWSLSLWRRDAAGNASEQLASVPVTLRYDPDPPQMGFEPPIPSDPTAVVVKVTDAVSGFSEGAIEISAAGSGTWHSLPVTREGDRMIARINDAGLPPGPYELRARASDLARNEASTTLRLDGQPMVLNLPLRLVSTMQSVFERERAVTRKRKRERVVVQTQTARVLFGESARIAGRLIDPAGAGVAEAEVQVYATTPIGPEQLVTTVVTDAEGRYAYDAAGTSNRSLRLVYVGSATVLPSEGQLSMTVPAATELRVSSTRLRNGQSVTFSGPVRSLPTPAGGKLIEMQVKLPGRWETFRTIRSDDAGQWSVRYRFRRTSGVQHYRFRARLPAEGSYPFVAGVSRVASVRVRGPR